NIWPPESSPRRLAGYPTFAFGFGSVFFIVFDSNIPRDAAQLAWVADQLNGLDRTRFRTVIAVCHHPPITSGQHGGAVLVEAQSAGIRDLYLPLFRKHHVRMTITGHDHLLDHWVEHYEDAGKPYRLDHVVSGGGGAPTYVYRGEPDLEPYMKVGAAERVSVQHLIKPGPAIRARRGRSATSCARRSGRTFRTIG